MILLMQSRIQLAFWAVSAHCPLPGSVQGQVGWSSEQPGLVEDVPAHGREIGTR